MIIQLPSFVLGDRNINAFAVRKKKSGGVRIKSEVIMMTIFLKF